MSALSKNTDTTTQPTGPIIRAMHIHYFIFESPQPNKPIIKGVCACGAVSEGLSQMEYASEFVWLNRHAKGLVGKR